MNVLPLPENFDKNEWFIIISIVLALFVIAFLPKRFPVSSIIIIALFNINLVKVTDYVLAIKPLDLYDFLDVPKLELVYYIAHYVLFPAIAYLFLYFYDKKEIKGISIFFYILIWALFSTGYEWAAVKVDVLRYVDGKWNLWYSFFVYVTVFVLNVTLLKFLKGSDPLLRRRLGA